MGKTKHIRSSLFEVIKYRLINLIEDSQRKVSFISHLIVLLNKIYGKRNNSFLSSYIGYYLSFVLVFINYIFYLNQLNEI